MREELKEYIKLNGIKQKHLAEELGISPSLLCKYLKGTRNLNEETLSKLRKIIY